MRTNIHGDEGNEDANLENYDADKYLATEPGDNDEGAAVEDDNSSLWIDPRKTPMDRIQVRLSAKLHLLWLQVVPLCCPSLLPYFLIPQSAFTILHTEFKVC